MRTITELYSTAVHYCTVQYNSTVLYSIVEGGDCRGLAPSLAPRNLLSEFLRLAGADSPVALTTLLYSTLLHLTALHYTTLHYLTALHSTALHCTTLYSTLLHHSCYSTDQRGSHSWTQDFSVSHHL